LWGSFGAPYIDTSSINFFWIFLAGFVGLFAEFLYVVVSLRLSGPIVIATFDVAYIFGLVVTYSVDSTGIILLYMIIGSDLIFTGIISFVFSEVYKQVEGGNSKEEDPTATDDETKPVLSARSGEGSEEVASEDKGEKKPSIWFWVMLGLLGGCCYGSAEGVLPTLARTGTNAIEDAACLYFVFSLGTLAALPVIIFFFAYLDVLGLMQIEKIPNKSCLDLVDNLFKIPLGSGITSLCISLVYASAYVAYFYGTSGDIPYAISFMLLSLMIVFGALTSIFVLDEYKGISFFSAPFYLIYLGFVFYALGVFVLVDYSF